MPIAFASGSKWKGFFWGCLSGATEPIGALLVSVRAERSIRPLGGQKTLSVAAGCHRAHRRAAGEWRAERSIRPLGGQKTLSVAAGCHRAHRRAAGDSCEGTSFGSIGHLRRSSRLPAADAACERAAAAPAAAAAAPQGFAILGGGTQDLNPLVYALLFGEAFVLLRGAHQGPTTARCSPRRVSLAWKTHASRASRASLLFLPPASRVPRRPGGGHDGVDQRVGAAAHGLQVRLTRHT